MSKLSLTRFLYFLEEVKISLTTCILQKNSLKECYFWISELFYSGFEKECYCLLWKIYYDFYYLNNKKVEQIIKKKTKTVEIHKSSTTDINVLRLHMKIATILFNCEPCPSVFLYRLTTINSSTDDVGEKLKHSLEKGDCKNANGLIKQLCETDIDSCIKILESFKGETFCDNNYYENKFHLLLCFSCKSYPQTYDYKLKFILKNLNDIKEFDKPCKYSWNTLNKKRLYSINETIGCFALGTNENNCDKKKIWGEFWENFAKKTPLWKTRIERYNGYFKGKTLCFKSIDEQEEFYDNFNYEPDEKIDNFVSIPPKNKLSDWVENIFDIPKRVLSILPKRKINY
tara:strand:- start:339 stop:1367 length:1029 start_codon:yes stop_codon:yes gene_type:complete